MCQGYNPTRGRKVLFDGEFYTEGQLRLRSWLPISEEVQFQLQFFNHLLGGTYVPVGKDFQLEDSILSKRIISIFMSHSINRKFKRQKKT